MSIDTQGNVIVVGTFAGTIKPGQKLITSSNYDAYVAKFAAADGSPRWAMGIGGSDKDNGFGVATDSNDNIVISGNFVGPVEFGDGSLTYPPSGSPNPNFVAKYSAEGKKLFVVTFPTSVTSIATDGGGNILVTGTCQGTLDLGGPTPLACGVKDLYVAKYL